MQVENLKVSEVKLLTPRIFEDDRGFFFESFNHAAFENAIGHQVSFVQDNHSKSSKGVLRGLHDQMSPFAQGKLVRVVQGEVFDVAVDMRSDSPTFGQWVSTVLSASNKKQLWIPAGFAHGFLTLSDTAEFLYKTTDYYDQASERSMLWSDKTLNIDWPDVGDMLVAEKDRLASAFLDADTF